MKFAFFLVLAASLAVSVTSILQANVLQQTLPKPLSDFSASLMGGKIYLAGGCDSPDGNVYVKEISGFACFSISKSFYEFDPQTLSVTKLNDLPSQRFRHVSVAVNNQVWLVGGRDVNDTLVSTVDVYDFATQNWTTYDLPSKYVSSDLTSFDQKNYAYFAGGYTQDYLAVNTVFRIDTIASTSTGSLVIEDRASLLNARGDTGAASDNNDTYAIITGGFTHLNNFCQPLDQVELYNFDSDSWTEVAPMHRARSDMAVVELNGFIYTFGGERQIENYCEVVQDYAVPGELTIAVDDVERYDKADNIWATIGDLPYHRFRFAAEAIDKKNTIYTFGGQNAFDLGCSCFRTSNQIVTYTKVADTSATFSSSAFVALSALAVSAAFMLLG